MVVSHEGDDGCIRFFVIDRKSVDKLDAQRFCRDQNPADVNKVIRRFGYRSPIAKKLRAAAAKERAARQTMKEAFIAQYPKPEYVTIPMG